LVVTLTTDGSTPIDISGTSFLLTVDPSAEPADDSANLYQITGSIINAAAGTVGFTPSSLQSAAAAGEYYYDIQWTNGSTIRTIMKGKWTIRQDITK